MGYETPTLIKLLTTIKLVFGDFKNLSMIELGNQEVYDNFDNVVMLYKSYNYDGISRVLKPFFSFLGFNHISIDYNGKDGAIPLDVRQSLLPYFPHRFNVLTNLGFTEHVGENDTPENMINAQYQVFKNLHDLGDINALYYHVVPLKGYWYKHGVCDYTLDFFEDLCKLNNYEIIQGPFIEDYHKELHASVFYKKIFDTPFISIEEFKTIRGLRSTFFD